MYYFHPQKHQHKATPQKAVFKDGSAAEAVEIDMTGILPAAQDELREHVIHGFSVLVLKYVGTHTWLF